MNAAAIPQAVGDWSLRGVDADQVFANQQLSDTAMTAACRVTARFDPSFPGWFLYRRVVAGVGLFDRQLEAWAITNARMLSRMTKDNGRQYISAATRGKPGWIAQAGRDALDFAIYGKYAEALESRSDRFGVHWKTYKQIREPISACMWVGLDTFRSELHAEYFRVRRREKRGW
jgi:hypothetical protein